MRRGQMHIVRSQVRAYTALTCEPCAQMPDYTHTFQDTDN